RSFLDNTSKTIRISIVSTAANEPLLLQKEYRLHAANLGWDATWDEHNNLTVVLFEYPAGVNLYDLSNRRVATNHIRSVIFRFDPGKGTFTEQKPTSATEKANIRSSPKK